MAAACDFRVQAGRCSTPEERDASVTLWMVFGVTYFLAGVLIFIENLREASKLRPPLIKKILLLWALSFVVRSAVALLLVLQVDRLIHPVLLEMLWHSAWLLYVYALTYFVTVTYNTRTQILRSSRRRNISVGYVVTAANVVWTLLFVAISIADGLSTNWPQPGPQYLVWFGVDLVLLICTSLTAYRLTMTMRSRRRSSVHGISLSRSVTPSRHCSRSKKRRSMVHLPMPCKGNHEAEPQAHPQQKPQQLRSEPEPKPKKRPANSRCTSEHAGSNYSSGAKSPTRRRLNDSEARIQVDSPVRACNPITTLVASINTTPIKRIEIKVTEVLGSMERDVTPSDLKDTSLPVRMREGKSNTGRELKWSKSPSSTVEENAAGRNVNLRTTEGKSKVAAEGNAKHTSTDEAVTRRDVDKDNKGAPTKTTNVQSPSSAISTNIELITPPRPRSATSRGKSSRRRPRSTCVQRLPSFYWRSQDKCSTLFFLQW
uniref:Uncharacterized protein n=1 Tax=Lotharella globosa TaxID=91324 RepID=A0A7S3YIS7_9EUKA|mmetsp:Transcript_5465/g.10716  ORF Transcript_5465/g.10716 Transcript_5465/m.10716 type:complete len:486 (-) Transcript_5465:495-1952(-)